MKILVVGGGGREHALCWKLAQSEKCEKLYCAPGNGGTADVAENIDIKADDVAGLVTFVEENKIDFVVVGPEVSLVLGLTDELQKTGIPTFGPSAKAAQLEGSKSFTKDMCKEYNIPTAAYGVYTDLPTAQKALADFPQQVVIKADGLAAGKGVIICESHDQAMDALEVMMTSNQFGKAGAKVVIEEFMTGEEASFFALTDGTAVMPLASAQDHKRAFDGDKGPNTGGMGAYSPAPIVTDEMEACILDEIIHPTVKAMANMGAPFQGVLYAGLMLTADGPKLIEYNVRFGDPECQVLMQRLESDLVDLLYATATGTLDQTLAEWSGMHALTVVLAAAGYPGSYEKGVEIKNLDAVIDATIFHAGTKQENGKILSSGGRVLNVTSCADTLAQAQQAAYNAVDQIDWDGGFCRRDIGWRALQEKAA